MVTCNDGSSDNHENFANAIGFIRLPLTFPSPRFLYVSLSFSLPVEFAVVDVRAFEQKKLFFRAADFS